jgi:peptidoglycan/LPS O-acetylase OafA/YrhL
VIAHHVGRACGLGSWVVWRGVIGVDIFFAISGLLITSQLLEQSDLRQFYVRRAFRILPPASLYLLTVALLGLTYRTDLLSCLFIHRNYTIGPEYTGHFWSLSLEEQFYLAWPLVLLWSRKRGPTAALVAIAAVCAWRYYVGWHFGVLYHERTELRCDGLLWGCVGAFLLRAGSFRIGRMAAAGCLVAAPAIWGVPAFLPFMPALLAAGVMGTVVWPEWALSRLLESRVLVWIGQRSYGIYLWQQLFIFAPVRIPMAVRLALAFLWPAVLYRYFESPLRHMGRRIAKRVGKQAGQAQARPTIYSVSHIIGVDK